MKRIKIAVLLILLCVLAGCSPKDTSLRAYCTESQQEFLDRSQEELPVALTYHHNDNILGRYETTDEEIISGILQALRGMTVVSKASSGSTDSRILSLRQRMGIPVSSGLMKIVSAEPVEHTMCFPAMTRSGIWRGKFRKHIRNTGKRWSKKADRKSRAFLACMQLRPRKQGTPGLFIFVFQTRGSLGFGFICSLSPSTQNSTLYFRNFRIFFRAAAMDFCTA